MVFPMIDLTHSHGSPNTILPSPLGDLDGTILHQLLGALPVAAYTCESEGLITYFNSHAEELWGRAPKLNDPSDRFCGSSLLFSPSGSPISHEECWMAQTLRSGSEFKGCEVVIERPDCSRVSALAHASPIHDSSGRLVGAVNILVELTEHNHATDAVLESESFLRMSQQAAHCGSWEWDLTRNQVKWSEEMYRIHGLSRSSVEFPLNETWRYVHPTDMAMLRSGIRHLLKHGEFRSVEYRISRPDGTMRTLLARGYALTSSNGQIERVIGTALDITERRKSEETIQRIVAGIAPKTGEDFFCTLANHLSNACEVDFAIVCSIDPAKENIAHTLAVSHHGELKPNTSYTLADTPCDMVVGCSYCYHPAGVQAKFPKDMFLHKLGIESYMGTSLFSSTGEPIGLIALMHTQPFSDPDQAEAILKVVAARAGAELERDRAQKALQDSQRFLNAVSEQSPYWIYVFDLQNNRAAYVNRPILRDLGYSPEEYKGKRLDEYRVFLAPGESDTLVNALDEWRSLKDGEIRSSEQCFLAANGDHRWFACQEQVFSRGAEGQVQQVIGTLFEITERKLAEEERRLLETQMLHAQKLESLGVLAGGIAHDFNNLLTAVIGYSELATSKLPKDSPALPMLEGVEKSAMAAGELTRQMLAYSGRASLVKARVALDLLAEETSNLLNVVIPKSVNVQLELLPATVEGDETQIRQVIMNLITNASDSFDGKAGSIIVRSGARSLEAGVLRSPYIQQELPDGDYAFIEVSDTGCGMDPEVRSRMFEPFYTSKFSGRGLGLPAVLGIVRGHRGTILVASEVNLGTTVTVYFPASSTQPATAMPEFIRNPIDNAGGTILVIDDEVSVLTYVCHVLDECGYVVLQASGGVDGLNLFDERLSDIRMVILDLTMPEMDGWQVAARLKARRPDIPILLMSGYSETDISIHDNSMGIAGFIQKPFRGKDLLAQVNTVLEAAQLTN
jgi:PAS domain S-box-containing protein